MSKRILVASHFDEHINEIIQKQADVDVVQIPSGVPEEVPESTNIVFVRPFLKSGQPRESQPPVHWQNVKWVQISSIGLDYFPDWTFENKIVTSAQGLSSVAIAEFIMTLILTHIKRVPEIWITNQSQWTTKKHGLLAGQTIGILGYGTIAHALIERLNAFGVRILVKRFSDQPIHDPHVQRVQTVEQLFSESDHVVLAAPATAQTYHLINQYVLSQAKAGLHLINIARGSLVDEDALLVALDEGKIALASLDVTQVEPLPNHHLFYSHPKVRLSPHVAPGAPSIERGLLERFIDNLHRFKSGQPLLYQIDIGRGY